MNVIEIRGLRKEYHSRGRVHAAVDSLDLAVPAGGVYGFLGPNGSGKTTTIPCLLGLVGATAGRISLLGVKSPRDLGRVVNRIGSIVETPTFFPNFSAQRNLSLLAGIAGVPASRVDAALSSVGLRPRAKQAVRGYSLGMRQRLGIAAALLKDPELLILDEPANGLDPAGIKEIRDLLRHLGSEGRTVFVSSHLLTEVQQTCDRVAILARGRLVSEGPVDEVIARGRPAGVVARLPNPDDLPRAVDVLSSAGLAASCDGEQLDVALDPCDAARITALLAHAGMYVRDLRPVERDLETVFLELTGESS
jgi:ABC-type multidrug transport system ATPase subunit